MRRFRRRVLTLVGRYTACALVLGFVAFPLYGVLLTSVQRERDVRSPDLNLIPTYLDFRHYEAVLDPGHIVPIAEAMRNSFIVSLSAAVIAVALATPACYALNRLRLPGQRLILGTMVSVYVLPTMLFIIPLYVAWIRLGLFDTYAGLVIPYVAFLLPFAVWILGSFLRSIPIEVEEAAKVDGATPLQTLWLIVVPLLRPGVFAVLLLGFILSWVEFVTPLLFTSDIKILTVALGLYRSTFDIQIGQLAAAAVLTALPVIGVTVVFQRWIQEVITVGIDR
jgi:ABC-type glycerol-3-phosphate transport system permease component